jgi:DNA-binding NarL/FixJ family response regulator
MQIFQVNHLIVILIGIDIIFFAVLVLLFRQLRQIKQNSLLSNEIDIFESLIRDSDETAGQFNEQLKGKVRFIKKLNHKLDKRIGSLNLLLNRSNLVLSANAQTSAEGRDKQQQVKSRRRKILEMAKDGNSVEAIATKLSIPRGEVRLTLNMQRTLGSESKGDYPQHLAKGTVAN